MIVYHAKFNVLYVIVVCCSVNFLAFDVGFDSTLKILEVLLITLLVKYRKQQGETFYSYFKIILRLDFLSCCWILYWISTSRRTVDIENLFFWVPLLYFKFFSWNFISRQPFLSSPSDTETNHVDKCLTHDIAFKFQTEKIWKLLFIKKSFSISSLVSLL